MVLSFVLGSHDKYGCECTGRWDGDLIVESWEWDLLGCNRTLGRELDPLYTSGLWDLGLWTSLSTDLIVPLSQACCASRT